MSVADTSQTPSSVNDARTSGMSGSRSHTAKKSESRACKMHIVGGIAMLGIGIALLVIT